eukprot:886141_1
MDPSDNRDANFLSNKQDFAYFLAPDNGETFYTDKIDEMVNGDDNRLVVNLRDINEYDPNLRRNILSNPMDYIPAWEEALKDYIEHNQFSVEKQRVLLNDYKIGLKGSFGGNRLTPQKLMSQSVGTMVCCEGIVTKVSLVRPKVKETVHFCSATQQFTTAQYRDGTSLIGDQTSSIYPTTDNNGNNLTTEFGLCTFSDHQKIYIQDMPERTEAGSMPQSVECILDNDLVDKCKPGDRVQIIGIYRALCGKRISGESSGKFHTVILVNNIIKIGISGTGSDNSSKSKILSASEIKNIKKYSKKKNIFNILSNSIIPSIHGHSFIKKAILLQLLGGITKDLPNGTHLRGDINILMIGDPSCGKSQLLRGVMNIGNLVINTTGRGSSGVGLTAAVTMDKDSGDKKLEAGAMVLADGGIVCIDEFDKMSESARSILHEVMEQQTVSIAKAGIICTLNARTSVLAAANPIESRYNPTKSVIQNIDLPPTLMSRFDLIYLVLDRPNENLDKKLAKHIISLYWNDEDRYEMRQKEIQNDPDTNIRLTQKELMEYISYSRRNIQPKISEEAAEKLIESYVEMRSLGRINSGKTITATPRQLESLIRLSESLARMRHSKYVQDEDVDEAVRLHRVATMAAATDPRTGAIDLDSINVGTSAQERQLMQAQANNIIKILKNYQRSNIRANTLLTKYNDAQGTNENDKINMQQFKKIIQKIKTKEPVRAGDWLQDDPMIKILDRNEI